MDSHFWSTLIGAVIGAAAAISAQAVAEMLRRQRERESALRVMKAQAKAVASICCSLDWTHPSYLSKARVLCEQLAPFAVDWEHVASAVKDETRFATILDFHRTLTRTQAYTHGALEEGPQDDDLVRLKSLPYLQNLVTRLGERAVGVIEAIEQVEASLPSSPD